MSSGGRDQEWCVGQGSRWKLIGLLAAMLVVPLAGCGSGDGQGTSPPPPPPDDTEEVDSSVPTTPENSAAELPAFSDLFSSPCELFTQEVATSLYAGVVVSSTPQDPECDYRLLGPDDVDGPHGNLMIDLVLRPGVEAITEAAMRNGSTGKLDAEDLRRGYEAERVDIAAGGGSNRETYVVDGLGDGAVVVHYAPGTDKKTDGDIYELDVVVRRYEKRADDHDGRGWLGFYLYSSDHTKCVNVTCPFDTGVRDRLVAAGRAMARSVESRLADWESSH